jgi:DNA-binding NarL/FixJ family response regulator
VLTLLTHSNAQIALLMGISKHTVRNHITNLAIRFGIRGRGRKRPRLLHYAVTYGVVDPWEISLGDKRVQIDEEI